VRDALTHLFDAAHLQHHPLLQYLVPSAVADPRARAQALRELLLQAINDLRPPAGVSPLDPAYRPYAILQHKYAEGFPSEEIQRKLAISRRQFYREQYRACDAVAGILWERRLPKAEPVPAAERALDEELDEMSLHSQPFSLRETVQQAIAAVLPLAASHGIELELQPGPSATAYADEAVSRQLAISILSTLVKQGLAKRLWLSVDEAPALGSERWASFTVGGVSSQAGYADLRQRLEALSGMARRIGGQLDLAHLESQGKIGLRLPSSREQVVAIVDDNAKTLRLFQRYLEPYRYRLLLIQDGGAALSQIAASRPDAVVLDVMMHGTDGWQILQSLKADPATASIPVIVCSVLNEQELASAIGADSYLRKPVSQLALVQALATLLRQR